MPPTEAEHDLTIASYRVIQALREIKTHGNTEETFKALENFDKAEEKFRREYIHELKDY